MSAVKNTHLSFAVGLLIIREYNRKSGFIEGQLSAYVLFAFNNPKCKRLSDVQQLVCVTEPCADSISTFPRKAGYNAVNKRAAKNAGDFNPIAKSARQGPAFA